MLRMPVFPVVLCSAIMLTPTVMGQSGVLPAESFDGATSHGLEALPPQGDPPDGLSATEWSSIRAAYEANRHAAFAVSGGYQARNPGQQWLTRFDGHGFSTEPDAGGWTWGLQLDRYGFAGSERALAGPAQVSAAGQRVAYDWDATLQEWYVNDTRGLEHGYTVHQRPPQEQAGPLTFTLAVRGGLAAQVHADGRGVRFVRGDGTAVLTYAGLSVFDADGKALPARFEPLAEGLLLSVDERGARYPLTIDPIVQQAYLKASNTEAADAFGSSVSVSGDTVVVGAPSAGTGFDFQAGAAYVFLRSGTSWSQQAALFSPFSFTGNSGDNFGESVSVSGDTLVVGAPGEDSNATGVNGNSTNNSSLETGAAYVFVRSGTNWSQQAYLKASNTPPTNSPFDPEGFGESVSVSGDTVVVGASGEDSNATGVNGDQSNNGASSAGAAYAFVRSGTNWSQQAYLKASNTGGGDQFGSSVAVSGDTVVVGASGEDSNATGVNGDQSNNGASSAGAAYAFVRSGTSWSQQAYLKASNSGASDEFGNSVSVSGDTVVVGAHGEDSDATGVNGDQSNNSAAGSGAAYVFVRSGTSWSQQAYLKASNTAANDNFSGSVSVSGNTVVVGASSEDSNATGVNGDPTDNSALGSGASYVYDLAGAAAIDLISGTAGSLTGVPQSFNETRGVDLTVLSPVALTVNSMTLTGLTIGSASSALVGARIYQSSNSALIASGTVSITTVTGPLTVPISATLASNTNYRAAFFISTSPAGQGGGTLFDPSPAGSGGFPYTETSGLLRINSAHSISSDSFPAGSSIFVPQIKLNLPTGNWTSLGNALAGTAGSPVLTGTGVLSTGSSNQLDLTSAKPSSPATLIFGVSALNAPFKGGVLVPNPFLMIYLATNGVGAIHLPFVMPTIPGGVSLFFQYWMADAAAVAGFAASNGLKGVTS